MDIAKLSMGMSQIKVRQQASLSVMKMAMESSKKENSQITKMMEQSVNPHVGGTIDIKV